MRYTLNTELSDRETYVIGSVVSQWGFLESDIFDQTISTFEEGEELPKSMISNAQFSRVLKLWLARFVEAQDTARQSVLKEQYERIVSLNEFRQAIVHSRWEWKPDDPETITAVRVHKQSIKRVRFTFEGLAELATSLGEIRYLIRYPGGLEDRAEEMAKLGGHISRKGIELLFGRVESDSSFKDDDDN